MRRIAVLFLSCALLLLSCPEQLRAQNFRVDSLRALLRTEGRTLARVDHLNELAFAISDAEFTTEYTEIVAALHEANTLATELHYKAGLAYAPMGPSFQALSDGRYGEAIAGYKTCIANLDAAGIAQGMRSPLADIRRVYTVAGLQEERLAFYRDALERYRRSGPALNVAICEHGLGGYYLGILQYGQAIEHYMKAREGLLAVDGNDAANETSVIGQCYLQWGNLDRAEPYVREARQVFIQEKNMDQAAMGSVDLGDLECMRGDTLRGLQLYRSTRPYWNKMSPLLVAFTRTRLVVAYIATGDLDSARAEVVALNTLYAPGTLPLWSMLGECEVEYTNYLFQKAIGQNELAEGHLENALNEALRVSYLKLVLKYRKELSARYLQRGDAQNAAIQAQAYIHLNDSLQARANSTSLAVYEGQVKERESVLELQEQKLLRNGFLCGFLLVALFALVFLLQRNRISMERKRSDQLLLNILPAEVANELKAKGHAVAKHFDSATILFTDFKGFTEASEKLSPKDLVEELNTCFMAFDHIITARGIEKIKTIGDAYMCVGGLPDPKSSTPADVVQAALEMQAFMTKRKTERDAQGLPAFEMRVGIHTGPVVAGIVGVKKFQYDIWGDTVNTASRMESSGEVGQVNISEATYELVKNAPGLTFTSRGKVQAKGKGELEMYFVEKS